MHFDRNLFTYFSRIGRGPKSFNGFRLGTFIGRFPSDGVGSMAVKGLMGLVWFGVVVVVVLLLLLFCLWVGATSVVSV